MLSATLRNRNAVRLGVLRLVGRGLARRHPPPTAEPQRVLLLRPDHIGDVLLTSPAIALLRESLPRAHLTYLVGPWSADVARAGPAVDRLQVLAFPGFTRRASAHLLAPYATLLREAARLRPAGYDLAVVFRPDHWWGALLALVAGIPMRVGSRTPETTPLLTHARSAAPREHATRRALELARFTLEALGVAAVAASQEPSFRVTEPARQSAQDFWARHSLGDQRVVALAPSAGAPLKSWPVERWARLADELRAQGSAVLLVGSPHDGQLLAAIQARLSRGFVAAACGQPLGVSAALFERCALLVGLDGGQAHLAGAVGTRTVRLYGPAATETFGPWPQRREQAVLVARGLACVPCGQLEGPPCRATTLPACLMAVDVEDVLNAVNLQFDRH